MSHSQRNLSRQDLYHLRGRSVSGRTDYESPHSGTGRAVGIGDILYVFVLIVAGLLLRLDFLIPSKFVIDADEGIVGLMAKHMAEGGPMPIFYYGQDYMGSLEPWLVSLLFELFGISNEALKFVPLAFSLLLIPTMFLLGLEFGGKTTARLAALFTAIPPVGLVVWSGKARGGFVEVLLLGALALLLAVRWNKERDFRLSGLFVFSFLIGFGWWTNNQMIFFAVPVGLVVLSKLLYASFPDALSRLITAARSLVVGLCASILGALPFWLYNIENHFASFNMFRKAGGGDLLEHLQGLFTTALPILFGAKHFWETADVFPKSTLVAYLLNGFLFLAFLCFYRREISNLFRLRVAPNHPAALLLVLILTTFILFVASSFGHLVQAPRYLLPAYVGLFLLWAVTLERLSAFFRGAVPLVVAGLLGFHVASAYAGGRAIPGEPIIYNWDRVSFDHAPLINFLDSHGYRWVRTNYWIGYRLAFETREQTRFLVFREPMQTRIESYRTAGRLENERLMPLVLSPTQAPIVASALAALGYTFERAEVGGYIIFHQLKETQPNLRPVARSAYAVHATQHDENAPLAADDDPKTRWGSGQPQAPGMSYELEFQSAQTLRGLTLDFDGWDSDFPRGLKIEAVYENGERKTLLTPEQYVVVSYYLNHEPRLSMMFDPTPVKRLVFTQTEADTVFDWSIAEVKVFE